MRSLQGLVASLSILFLSTGLLCSADAPPADERDVHAGYLCMAKVTLKNLVLTDSKTGHMDLKNRERRLAGDVSPELAALLKTKAKESLIRQNA